MPLACRTRKGRSGEPVDGRLVDRPRPQRAAEDEHEAVVLADAEGAARAGAVGLRRRHRAAGDPVARAGAPLEREGQADAPREGRQQAVGEAEVAVGLGQDERHPGRDGGRADRPGHVPPAAQHRPRADVAEDPARGADRAGRPRDGARRLDGVRAAEPLHPEGSQLVAGGRDELRLGALAAGEDDAGAVSPQLVGDGQRRDDVPRRPARRDEVGLGHRRRMVPDPA